MDQKKLDYIKKISKNLGVKSEFDIYDKDDIEQEIYFLVCQAENIYNEKRGDEYTFFFNYVKNRLSTLKRDKYGINIHKKQIADAITLECDIELLDMDFFGQYQDIIDKKMPAKFRADYLRFTEGVKIPHRNKVLLIEEIKEIVRLQRLEENDY